MKFDPTKRYTDSDYLELVIAAESPSTEIWLGDDEGHFVHKAVGVLRTRLLPGDYVVELGLGSTTYPIPLTESRHCTEAQLAAGPTCPRPHIE